jgi:hypothetical protein
VPSWESGCESRVLGSLKLQWDAERWSSGCQTMRNCFQPLPRNHSLRFGQCTLARNAHYLTACSGSTRNPTMQCHDAALCSTGEIKSTANCGWSVVAHTLTLLRLVQGCCRQHRARPSVCCPGRSTAQAALHAPAHSSCAPAHAELHVSHVPFAVRPAEAEPQNGRLLWLCGARGTSSSVFCAYWLTRCAAATRHATPAHAAANTSA